MAITNTATLASNIQTAEGEKIPVSISSNVLNINNIDTDVMITKSSSKSNVLPQDVVTITTLVTNNTTSELSDFKITDTLSNGATFVLGSLKIGSQEYKDINPLDGFSLPITIGVGAEMDIVYQIEIDKYVTQSTITNITNAEITIDGKMYEKSSNELSLTVLDNEVYLLKTANVSTVKSGDKIKYTITISNNGTLKNTDLVFTDKIPDGTTFVDNSVTIDGEVKENYNPELGFNLGDLDVNASIIVTFEVTVN